MGLFQSNKKAKKELPLDEPVDSMPPIFDEQYREELRASGREQFKAIIDDHAAGLKDSLDSTVAQVSVELKDHMARQLDATVTGINTAMTKRLDEQLREYDRITKDAQDQAVQSLNRNAQALHEKYQQLNATLQQTVTSQEAMMISIFEENKARMSTTQNAQETITQSLRASALAAEEQTKQLGEAIQKTLTDQEARIDTVFAENTTRITATKTAQETALQTLNASAEALQQHYQQLSGMLQKTVANQEALLVDVFENNMAQIIEHYLLSALGDQYDMKAQLPLIVQQMEENKQAIMDDMKL